MLDEQEIRRLLLATAARDVDAFARLYKRCAPLLLGVAQRITRRRELAEEGAAPSVVAAVSADRRTLELRVARPIVAGPQQSYELWVT